MRVNEMIPAQQHLWGAIFVGGDGTQNYKPQSLGQGLVPSLD